MSRILFFLSLIFLSESLSGQSIQGKVFIKNTNSPLAGVSIKIEGPSSKTTATDEEGIFSFQNNRPGKYSIQVSYLGYETYQSTLNLKDEGINLEIFLISQSGSLPEVQILSASRRNTSSLRLPFASSVLNVPTQSENIPRTVPESLSIIPGVFVQKTNHGGGSPFIRGLTGNQTLILIDGIRLNNSTFRYGPNQYLNTIDPFSVNKIEVLRGRPLLVYASQALGAMQGAQVSIDLTDIDGFTDLVNSIPADKRSVDVLIHSPGGSPDATERIVYILRNRFDEVNFLIPHSA